MQFIFRYRQGPLIGCTGHVDTIIIKQSIQAGQEQDYNGEVNQHDPDLLRIHKKVVSSSTFTVYRLPFTVPEILNTTGIIHQGNL